MEKLTIEEKQELDRLDEFFNRTVLSDFEEIEE